MFINPPISEVTGMVHGLALQAVMRGKFGWVLLALVGLGFWMAWRSSALNEREVMRDDRL